MATKQQRERRKKIDAYYDAGYTIVFCDKKTGELIPGYVDWSLRYVLDEKDACGVFSSAQSRSDAEGIRTRPLDELDRKADFNARLGKRNPLDRPHGSK